MAPRVLVIDDDRKLCGLLSDYLGSHGFEVLTAQSADAGLPLFRIAQPDIVVLDVMLPGVDGFEVCRTIRRSSSVPIVMLTARGEVTDRVVGLELGADDYMPKPFEPRASSSPGSRRSCGAGGRARRCGPSAPSGSTRSGARRIWTASPSP